MLLDLSSMTFILVISKEFKWKVEIGVTGSIIDELHFSDIEGYQLEGESGGTRSIIDELHSLDMIKRKVKVVIFEVSLMSFIFGYPTRSNGR